MPSVFSRIIEGEIPGRFVWNDEQCVAFLSIAPLRLGHALVVPRREIAEWTDAADDLLTHLVLIAKQIGAAQKAAFQAPRTGVIVAGFEVPHLHVHIFPSWGIDDFDFSRVDNDPDPGEMDRAMEKLRGALREAGLGERVPD